jgi:hypothetical protein
MRKLWFSIRTSFASFFARRRSFFRRLHWALIIAAGVLVFAIPIFMGIRNPGVHLADIHGPPPDLAEFTRDLRLFMNQAQREHARLADFNVLVSQLSRNYPFLELSGQKSGIDYSELVITAFDELTEMARYEIAPGFFTDFLNDRFLSLLSGFGGLRLTADGGLPPWLVQPYFFGLYDWRFYDDRFDIPVRDDNITTEILDDGILYLRINSFLPKGYESITRNPFWYFCFEANYQELMDIYNNLYGKTDLIIDIRGIGSGFRDYFVPLILAPHLYEPMSARFYAFHSGGHFSSQISYEYRTWYMLGEAEAQTQDFAFDLPENVILGFPIDIMVQPTGDAMFDGQIWLLTDSDNFSGPNFAYLQMAQDAGFAIVYEENPASTGWATSSIHLPHSGLSVRFNPLLFTDANGRPFEEVGPVYDKRLEPEQRELLGVALP